MVTVAVIVTACCLLVSLSLNALLIRVMYKEHRDTYMRLMCKDISEYKELCKFFKETPFLHKAMTEDVRKDSVESPHRRAIREWREKGKK